MIIPKGRINFYISNLQYRIFILLVTLIIKYKNICLYLTILTKNINNMVLVLVIYAQEKNRET